MSDIKRNNHNNINDSDTKGRNPLVITVFVSIFIMLIATAISFYFYLYTEKSLNSVVNNTDATQDYNQYYALICDNNDFNRQIYQYAKAKGDELDICVDMLSLRIDADYSIEELFEIAMESKVDGIIVEAKDAQKMKSLIDEACGNGMDVVTLLSDSPDSMRRSSVQVGAYNLGKTYGQQIVSKQLKEGQTIYVVTDASNKDSSQNLVFTGIQDYVYGKIGQDSGIQIVSYPVDGGDKFVMEEMVRSIFLDETVTPDIIICPDDQATEIVYQALVDYNKVGDVRLIGYHDSQTVLSGIRQGVIEATIVVDVRELGEYAVEALSEYKSTGFVSEYYSVDSKLIDENNISSRYAVDYLEQ